MMKPPITLFALDHQPAVIRTTTETIYNSIGGEIRGLSVSTSGTWDPYEDGHSCAWPGKHIQWFQGAGRTQGSLIREVEADLQP